MKKPIYGNGLTLLLVGLSVTNPFAFHIFLPSMPGLSETLGVSAAAMQLTVSIYVATFAVVQLCYGPLSDRFGRRRVILSGIAVYIVAPLFCAQVGTIESLVAGRAPLLIEIKDQDGALGVDVGPLEQAVAERADFAAPPFTVADFRLYRSDLRPGGPIHEELARYPLG